MATVVTFCNMLLRRAREKYGSAEELGEGTEILSVELDEVFMIIENVAFGTCMLTSENTLDLEEDHHSEDVAVEFDDSEESNSEQVSQDWEVVKFGNREYSIDVIRNVVSFYDSCVNHKLQQTKRRYKFVRDHSMLSRFRKYVDQNGRKSDKLDEVEKYVFQKFTEARANLATVSERDLRRWGYQKARELNLEFKASICWLQLLKKKHRIVSRKITKLTTTNEYQNQEMLRQNGNAFVENVKHNCSTVPSDNMWNFDQSGFNYEHSNFRTLSHKGEKDTLTIVKSMNAVTHSYTIMPLISMGGHLAGKLLICLQEIGGKLGPRVSSSLSIPNNIYLTYSRSGKLDKHIMKTWLNNYVSQISSEGNVLIFDSWAGQTDPSLYDDLPNIRSFFQIPPHTTQWIQPLDVYFFRQYKIVRRKLFDRSMLEDNPIDLKLRQNVLNMHSLIYNQFQAPSFRPMLQYAWYACGYTQARAGYFMNVNEILFDVDDHQCDDNNCEAECFIRCSHCRAFLCLFHFLNSYHFHDME